MKKLYYTVEKQTETVDTVEECTGLKTIQVYEMVNNKPNQWFDLEVRNDTSSEAEIQRWLDDNGYSDEQFEFVWL